MRHETREALRAIAEKGDYGGVTFTRAEARELLTQAGGAAPDLATNMDQRIPKLLEQAERGASLCASDCRVMAEEIRRLRVERDRLYWATQVAVRKIEEISRSQSTDEAWDEVHRG